MAPSATEVIQEIHTVTEKRDCRELQAVESPDENSNNGAQTTRALVRSALREGIERVDPGSCEAGEEDAFYVADMGEVYRQFVRWKLKLPRVKPHYAVKCNPDPELLHLLAALGTGFDCASKGEIEQILDLGVEASRIVYAQPCKLRSHIRYAKEHGIKLMTFDNLEELYKIKALYPEAELLLRILTDDSAAVCRLSLKFGAAMDCTEELLGTARNLGLNVVGVSFHVGSGASDPQSFLRPVQDSRSVFDQAAALGFDMSILDVGGGFTSDLFDDMADVLRQALDELFPPSVRIISEPGRYFAATAYTLACNVIARRTVRDTATQEQKYMLYVNDGVYGNFSSILFEANKPVAQILSAHNGGGLLDGEGSEGQTFGKSSSDARRGPYEYSIWGPTCDSVDCIAEKAELGSILDIGDWLYFENMGAYSRCVATRFNGFNNTHRVVYLSTELGASAILKY